MSDCICGYKKLWDRNIFLMIYEGEKMITYEWVQELQKISPPDRLRLLAKEDSLMQSCELILLSLNTVNHVIQEQTACDYFYYIFKDESVLWLIEESMCVPMPKDLFYHAMAVLDVSKLLYRFPCARKFEIPDPYAHQLRLNSWGRELVAKTSGHMSAKAASQIKGCFEQYFLTNLSTYSDLTQRLLDKIDSSAAKKIFQLNAAVELKLLS